MTPIPTTTKHQSVNDLTWLANITRMIIVLFLLVLATSSTDAHIGIRANLVAQDQEPEDDPATIARDQRIVESLMRLTGFDLDSRPDAKAAVDRYLTRVAGTERFLEVVDRLGYADADEQLVQLAIDQPEESLGVEAVRLLFQLRRAESIRDALADEDVTRVIPMIRALGRVGNEVSVDMLLALITHDENAIEVRTQAVRSIAKSRRGEMELMKMIEADDLDNRLEFAASDVLHGSTDATIVARIDAVLPLPASADSEPLPPISEMVTATGDVDLGRDVFMTTGTCIKCHQVGDEGKEVGPDLNEIGSKLSREALYESILDPSAGISHNYESYIVTTIDGTIVTGVLQSESDEAVVLKDAEAIEHRFLQEDIEDMIKQPISIMPAGLQKDLTKDDLVNLVEYLTTLKQDGLLP